MLQDIAHRMRVLQDINLRTVLFVGGFIVAVRYLQRYYRRRFGWVEPRNPTNKQAVIFALVMLVLIIFGRDIEHSSATASFVQYLQSMFHPAHQVSLIAPVVSMLFLGVSLRRHPQREERYRTDFLLLGTIAWSLVALSPLWWPEVTRLMFWKFLSEEWLGVSLIAVGLYDHMTLVRLLPQRIPQDASEGNNDEQ